MSDLKYQTNDGHEVHIPVDPKKIAAWITLIGMVIGGGWAGFGYLSRVASAPDELEALHPRVQHVEDYIEAEGPILEQIQITVEALESEFSEYKDQAAQQRAERTDRMVQIACSALPDPKPPECAGGSI